MAEIPEMPPATCPDKPSVDFSYVGIDAILEQMRRKAMKQGFELNIMVVGEFLYPDLFVFVSFNNNIFIWFIIECECLHSLPTLLETSKYLLIRPVNQTTGLSV